MARQREVRAWNAWLALLESRYALQRALKRMGKTRESAAFNTWSEMVYERERRLGVTRKFAARFLRTGLMRALNAWAELLAKRATMARFASRMTNRALGRALSRNLIGRQITIHLKANKLSADGAEELRAAASESGARVVVS